MLVVEVVVAEEVDLAAEERGIVGDLAGDEVPEEGDEAEDDDFAAVREDAVVTVGVETVEVFLEEAMVGEGPRGEAVGVDPTEGGEVGREPTTEATDRERVAEGDAGTAVGEDNADLLTAGLEAVVTVMEGRAAAGEEVVVVLGDEVGVVRTLALVALRAGVGLEALALEGALVVGEDGEAAERADEGAELGPEKVEAIAEMAGETVDGERAIRVRVVAAAEADAGE